MKEKLKINIYIDLVQESKNINIKIEDNAKGVDEKIIKNIFDPYFSTKYEKNGKGLSLYLLKLNIQKSLNGTLKAYNGTLGLCLEMEISFDNKKNVQCIDWCI